MFNSSAADRKVQPIEISASAHTFKCNVLRQFFTVVENEEECDLPDSKHSRFNEAD